VQTAIGLAMAFASAVAVNWAYAREHDAVAEMPPFSLRRPRHFVSQLLSSRRWLLAFGTETAGWLVYIGALRLAPLSLVQVVGAAGIAVLAYVGAQCDPSRLPKHERVAVALAFSGLVLLALSLVDTHQADHRPGSLSVATWLACLVTGALVLAGGGIAIARAPALGLAAGLLFAGGDISSKVVVYGGIWVVAAIPLVVFYGLGTSMLQKSFQYGAALATAGLATLASNSVPIAAGFVIFGERLPHGTKGSLQLAAFASIVVGAVLLGRITRGQADAAGPADEGPPRLSPAPAPADRPR
jgi:hypothetical protein